MKKIYMPSDEILHKMQELDGDINTYLLIKAIESLIVDGVNYPNKGILKNAYKYLRDNPYIVRAICFLYPEEIKYSELAKYDIDLANWLINKKPNRDIYALDNIGYFSHSIQYNYQFMKDVIDKLDERLVYNPEYRFEYKNSDFGYTQSELLDDIFSTKILEKHDFGYSETIYKLPKIEPAYAVLLPYVTGSTHDEYTEEMYRKLLLHEGIKAYARRYRLGWYAENNKDQKVDLDNPDDETKRLIRCIKKDNNNLY